MENVRPPHQPDISSEAVSYESDLQLVELPEAARVIDALRPLWVPVQSLNNMPLINGSIYITGIETITPEALPDRLTVKAVNNPFQTAPGMGTELASFQSADLNALLPEEIIAQIYTGLTDTGIVRNRSLYDSHLASQECNEHWLTSYTTADLSLDLLNILRGMDTVTEIDEGRIGYLLDNLHIVLPALQPGQQTQRITYWPDKGLAQTLETFDLRTLLLTNPLALIKRHGQTIAAKSILDSWARQPSAQVKPDIINDFVKTYHIQNSAIAQQLAVHTLEGEIARQYTQSEQNDWMSRRRETAFLQSQLAALRSLNTQQQREGWLRYVHQQVGRMREGDQPETIYVSALSYSMEQQQKRERDARD